MLIGLTYDLKDDYLQEGFSEEQTAEFDRESTIAALEKAINDSGYKTERIGNIKALTGQLAAGKRWNLVFNICEGFSGLYSRESQVPALLEAFDIPYTFSDPLSLGVSLKKDITKIIAKNYNIKTPDFFTVTEAKDLDGMNPDFPLFVKPVAEGTSKGVTSKSKVQNMEELNKACLDLLQRFKQPVLVETFCPGREFTSGVVGSEYLGSLEVILKDNAEKHAYSYQNKENCEEFVEYKLLTGNELNNKIREMALKIWKIFGFRDGGRIDFMLDSAGELNFIEVNPLAGLHPEHSDLPILCSKLGISYGELINRIIDSALKRIGNEK